MLFLKVFVLLLFAPNTKCLEYSDLLIVILSQEEEYNALQAEALKSNIINQAKIDKKDPPKVILSHKLDIYGSWTIIPIFGYLSAQDTSASWYLFCTEFTIIKLRSLIKVLQHYDVEIHRGLWMGHALFDKEPTIIHHYADHARKFKYPNLASGFVVSKYLFRRISRKALNVNSLKVDFSIDSSYEFATFIVQECRGAHLTHNPSFCTVKSEDCATYVKQPFCTKKPVSTDKIYLAVKTCVKNYYERLLPIKDSWTKYAIHRGFFTDIKDPNFNESIQVPNTEHGHCEKTFAILKYVEPILLRKKIDWLVITDDDTILSLSRLLDLLGCYKPKKPVAIGERYGYRTAFIHGYDYLTGGAGVVLSTALVKQIISPGVCECPSASTPDDMFLFGVCLSHLSVKITHSPSFHQARANDYAKGYLDSHKSISFHKFWMLDPIEAYQEWFDHDDRLMFNFSTKHDEL